MADLHEGIVQQYAEHLLSKASSVVRFWTIVGGVAGLVLGAIAGFFSHTVIAHNAGYFAVVLGGLAGAFAGRGFGERRGVGFRFQAQMALRQLQIETRLVTPVRQAAVAAPAPAPAPLAAPAPPPATVAPAPVVPAPLPVAPAPLAPPLIAPAPAPLVAAPEPLAPEAPTAPAVAVVPPPAPVLLEPAAPPVTPPLSFAG